ncbi:MAG: hypothetical protein L3K04_03670 [Thermoplasmata archaeon]|nr:hypothetical protein [Thermoplasmata archaeon]MCI4341324.1 hypothetical protein [Thermoplasmata archaeon]
MAPRAPSVPAPPLDTGPPVVSSRGSSSGDHVPVAFTRGVAPAVAVAPVEGNAAWEAPREVD